MPTESDEPLSMQINSQRLVIRRSGTAPRRAYRMLAGLSVAILLLLVGYLAVVRTRPGLWVFVGVAFIVLLAVASSAMDLQARSKDALFILDRDEDCVLRDGEPVAQVSNIENVLIRDVLQTDDVITDYALVLQMRDSRRVLVAECAATDAPRKNIERAAGTIAEWAGVRVEQATRMADEDWIDKG